MSSSLPIKDINWEGKTEAPDDVKNMVEQLDSLKPTVLKTNEPEPEPEPKPEKPEPEPKPQPKSEQEPKKRRRISPLIPLIGIACLMCIPLQYFAPIPLMWEVGVKLTIALVLILISRSSLVE